MDQTIKETMNRDSKTIDEQIEFSNNINAVHRWILSFNQREEISRSCCEIAGKAEGCHKKKDLNKSGYEKDKADIQSVIHAIESLLNPFIYHEKEHINTASGPVAPAEIKDDILTAHEKGFNVSSQFV